MATRVKAAPVEVLPAVTIKELMIATGKSQSTVYEMLKDGSLPCYRTKHGYVVPRLWFEDWQRGKWTPEPDIDIESTPISLVRRRSLG